MIEVFVPYMAPSLNAIYSGIHWTARQKHVDAGHLLCKRLGLEPIRHPVHLTFVPVLGKGARARDCSNYAYAAKIIEDDLVLSGVLEDDGNRFVKSFKLMEPIVDRASKTGFRVQIERAE